MDFDFINMVVTSIDLKKTDEEAGTIGQKKIKTKNTFKIDTSFEFNELDKKTVKLLAVSSLSAPSEYELHVVSAFYFRFKDKIELEEAELIIQQSRTETIVYPYLRAFISNLLNSSGYTNSLMPLVKL